MSLYTSLEDTTKLRKLILENPELPLLIFVGEEAWSDNFLYELAEVNSASIKALTVYGDYYVDEEEFEEKIADEMNNDEEYKNLSDEDFDKAVKNKIANEEFENAIVIYVG
jgi:hypothetical protein